MPVKDVVAAWHDGLWWNAFGNLNEDAAVWIHCVLKTVGVDYFIRVEYRAALAIRYLFLANILCELELWPQNELY